MAYDRQYRREALANRDLNWSHMNIRLLNEAFTSRAKSIPCCRHCLSDTHTSHNVHWSPTLAALSPLSPLLFDHPQQLRSLPQIQYGAMHVYPLPLFAKGALTYIRGTSVRTTAQEQATHPGSDRQQEREMAVVNLRLVDVCCAIAFHYFAHAVQDVGGASYRCMALRASTLMSVIACLQA